MTATIARSEYERMQRIAEDQHDKHMAALVEIDRLREALGKIASAPTSWLDADSGIRRIALSALQNGRSEP